MTKRNRQNDLLPGPPQGGRQPAQYRVELHPEWRKEPDIDKLVSAVLAHVLGAADPALEPRRRKRD